jgi:hypothetical protein
MGNYIQDAEKRLEEERQRIRQQKQQMQARQQAKQKADQLHRDRENRQNSILY